jgi:predicted amidohydrolase
MDSLNVSFIQTQLYWQDIGANLAMLEEKIWEIHEPTDLILLPEMFNTGFTMDAKRFAEPVNFTTIKWMKQMAQQKNAAITGSYIVKESGNYFNRLYWIHPEGHVEYYDKRHLFRMGDEHLTFSPGDRSVIISYKGWKILPLICYDLRFPVWSRNKINTETQLPEYDLLIYVANWPAPRTDVWDTLLKARALENQCYSLGVNRVGTDGMKVDYSGHSACYSYKGELLNEINSEPSVQTITLDLKSLAEFRMKFPAYLDSDRFEIES